MEKKATYYKVDGTVFDITPKDVLQYEITRALIGGIIEMITLPNEDVFVCHEEGKLIDLPKNKRATDLWKKHFPIAKYPNNNDELVVGDVIIATPDCFEQ